MDWNIKLPETPADATRMKCSFCNDAQVPAEKAFSGRDAVICHDCVNLWASQLGPKPPDASSAPPEDPRTCSFCERTQNFADEIVSGPPGTYICTDCVREFVTRIPAA